MNNRILGVRIDDIYAKGTEFYLKKFLNSKNFNMITPVNPIMLMISRKNPNFRKVLNSSELNTCDGNGISMMFKMASRSIKRCPGSTLVYDVLDFSDKNHKKVFFLGAKPEVNKKARENIKKLHPKLKVMGYSPSYEKKAEGRFFDEEEKRILSYIKKFKPQVICAFLGAPFQETWFYNNHKELQKLGVKIGLSLGRTADFIAGYSKRAPLSWQNMHLEWLYRLFAEKGRLKKVFPTLPLFVLFSLKDLLFHKVYKD